MKWLQATLALGILVALTGLATAESGDKGPQHFGGDFSLKERTTFADLVSKSDTFDGKSVQVEANVKAVCKKKGCWMVLSDIDGKSETTVRIRMKDYGFFVPKDCDGSKAVVEGVFARKVLKEKMAKHYAEDGGKDPAKVQGDRVELTLTAHAVDIHAAKK